MFPKSFQLSLVNNRRHQQGSMLVIALFVIIVFGLLGLTMTRLLASSSETVIYEVLGQRALNAARSGLEKCLADKYPIASGITPCSNPTNYTFVNVAGLENCQYQVKPIDDVIVTDNAQTFTYSKFVSTGRCDAGNIIVTREVYVDALDKNP
ncbi:MSHA biogenesis protein MshP [Paraglaciecola aquimarina]|uniref:MSHA biogenesis protein MshP n=1 Tax=Paraglaciecola algarum TaxID=3050085 RepID=A0ABS9D5R2_9ALTE|nr:MSHA biogenesis protein MshP [Paraglaciecola sp. G1-23]MCF2947362.1 MSHA biogenesis protein MshP [Paraglaciecola sp. G1-23]